MNHRSFKIEEDYRRRKARTVTGGYLIVGLITVGQAEIEVLDVEVQVGQDELVLDHLPDDPRHTNSVSTERPSYAGVRRARRA